MATGKISKNARRSGLMGGSEAALVIENDATRGKVFVAVRNALKEAGIAFENLSSSHPVAISKGKFNEAVEIVKTTLADKYTVEKEDAGIISFVENAKKDPAKMVVKESPFEWFA
ncbi:MAG: hypothetical protein KBT47_03195 [Armatimonadetes bacterium]|nr:hypothetical protein [Candidatus Hippobium faecium]